MNLLYAAYVRMPTEKAHGLQIASMCSALAGSGDEVELVVPARESDSADSVWSYYELAQTFVMTYLPVVRSVQSPLSFLLGELRFARAVKRHVMTTRFDVVITRSAWVAFMLGRSIPVFYEAHDIPRRVTWLHRILLRNVRGIISTNRWKADFYCTLLRRSSEDVCIAPNGYDEKMFDNLPEKNELRRQYALPAGPLVVYTGNLYAWKGVDALAAAAKAYPNAVFAFVGGSDAEAERFVARHAKVPNIRHIPHQPHSRISAYLKAADILVVPNSAMTEESRQATSPLKLFEYLASGTPTVVADLPSMREVVDERYVTFFAPDDAVSLQGAIEAVLNDAEGARAKAAAARDAMRSYTWSARAQTVRSFITRAIAATP